MAAAPRKLERHNCISPRNTAWTSPNSAVLFAFGLRLPAVDSRRVATHPARARRRRGIAARQPLLGALFGFARAFHVNFRADAPRSPPESSPCPAALPRIPTPPQAAARWNSRGYVISPTASSVISGAWPGRTPRYPFLPGICASSAAVSTTFFSGVTISSWKVSAIGQLVVGRWLSAVSQRCSANDERPATNDRSYAAAFIFSAASSTSSIGPFM